MSDAAERFVHLHVHSDHSALDGALRLEEYVKTVASRGNPAAGLTDHGTLRGLFSFTENCQKVNIKPIYGCLLKGQEIVTSVGSKVIEEIKVGDKVLTHKGRFRAVTRVMRRRYSGIIYNVKIGGARKRILSLTEEHPILVRVGDGDIYWKLPSEIEVGRRIQTGGLSNWKSYVCFPKLSSLSEAGMVSSLSLPKYLPDYFSFDSRGVTRIRRTKWESDISWQNIPKSIDIDSEMAYFLGLYCAEGATRHRNDKGGRIDGTVTMTFGLGESYPEWVTGFLARRFSICATTHTGSNGKNTREVVFCCVPLAILLESVCGRGARYKKVPEEILRSSTEVRRRFLDGLFDGDGTKISRVGVRSRQRTLHTTSSNLAWSVKVLLASFGSWASLNRHIDAQNRVSYFLSENIVREYSRSLEDDRYLFKSIQKIDFIFTKNQTVYNFETSEDHSYVSDFVLHNCELYVCEDMGKRGVTTDAGSVLESKVEAGEVDKKDKDEERAAARKLYHLTAWALDDQGLKNLYRLTSRSWTEGFYYKPRVDLKALSECSAGVAIGTGCVGSLVNRHLLESRPREADVAMGSLFDIFGDRLYIEVMPHDFEGQRKANAEALAFYQASGKRNRLLATQDAHYLSHEDAAAHEILLAIGSHKTLKDSDRMKFQGKTYWLFTREEMSKAFSTHHSYIPEETVTEALDGTVELADRCTAKILIDPMKVLSPKVETPSEYKTDWEYLIALVTEGMRSRSLEARAQKMADRLAIGFDEMMDVYTYRIRRELKVLRKSGFVSYFLLVHDLCRWASAQGIARGPGRGSAAGSIVSFLLGITQVDPIEHRLMFERFIAPGRVSMPDVDLDFQDDRRGEVLDYLRTEYGATRVAQISTIGRMNGRQSLKDVARVFDVPYQRSQVAAAAVDQDPVLEGKAINEAIARSEFFREFQTEWPTVVKHAVRLEGINKSLGVHPAGVVVSPVPLDEVLPLEARGANREQIVTAFDMRGVEGLGLLKIDVLGLKAVSVLEDTRRLLKARGIELVYNDIPLDDQKVLDCFTAMDFIGVFQFDTSSSYSVCDGLEFQAFDDIAAVNAINRPGAIDFAVEFKRRRSKPSSQHLFHPKVSAITADSLGLMIFQEHVIKVFTDVAGFTPEHADSLRKKIGKSEGVEAMESDRESFVAGCAKTTPDMERETADRLFSAIAKFGRYAFNRAHSVCYSLLAYWNMFSKVYHPLEFYCATLRRETDAKKIQRVVRDAKAHEVEVLLPDVNVSGESFAVDYEKRAVRGALSEIKGIGPAAVSEIIRVRDEKRYDDLIDFLTRAHGKKVNKRTIEALARGGALDELMPNPRWFVNEFDKLWKSVERGKSEQLREPMKMSERIGKWSVEDRLRVAAEVNPLALPPHPLIKWEPWIAENIKVPLTEVDEGLLSEERNVFVMGVVTETAVRSVGDAHYENDLPNEEARKVAGWGKPWARITIEGLSGEPVWSKIDWVQYEEFKSVIEKGTGALVIACAETRPRWRNLDIHFIADIEEIDYKLSSKPTVAGPLTLWERLFTGKYHPAFTYPWINKSDARLARTSPEDLAKRADGSFWVIGVVAHLYLRDDKRGQTMAFFGIAGYGGYIRVLCFASSWNEFGKYVEQGVFARLRLRKLDENGVCVLDLERGGKIQLLQKEHHA